ncbi:MAG: hypothetical protein ACR2GD_02160 [Pyrinomonadaceae bacterium]
MKIYKTFLVALCAVAFLACSQFVTTPSPTEVFKTQLEAQKKKDVAVMKQNLSKSSLELIEKAAKAQNKTLDEALAADNPMAGSQPDTFETRNEKITGDTATVEMKAPQSEEWVTMPFVKEDGKWKIALDKFMQDLMQKMSEQTQMPNGNSPQMNLPNEPETHAAPPANK